MTHGMNALNLCLQESYKPATFAERGVAVPFTTPQLAGVRVRVTESNETEFLINNPSGGRGIYILGWEGVRQFFSPSVHDTILQHKIRGLDLNPSGVRFVARRLAAKGLAGREAMVAALSADAVDQKNHVLTNFPLLVTLMEQVEPTGLTVSVETRRTPELNDRARRLIPRMEALTNRDNVQLSADLEALSALFVDIGLDANAPLARLPRLDERLEATGEALVAWAKRCQDDECAGLASSLARIVRLTALCADATLRAARAMINDMPALLQAWAASPTEVTKQVSRTEWVLDGWERFCLLWETASVSSAQRAVLQEMAQLAPSLPGEVTKWGEAWLELEGLEPAFRSVRLNNSWRTGGASHTLLARNEQLQARLL